jgi:hypothetical protein
MTASALFDFPCGDFDWLDTTRVAAAMAATLPAARATQSQRDGT